MVVHFRVALKIQKPVSEVFRAVTEPARLSGYFVEFASGPLVPGAQVMWKFAELAKTFPVQVREVIENARIVLEWPAGGSAKDTRVEMTFTAIDPDTTLVAIAESGWAADEEGLKGSHGNAGGWMHMLACLKAYLEYGINLRAGGAF